MQYRRWMSPLSANMLLSGLQRHTQSLVASINTNTIILPGIERDSLLEHAKNAAWGPPYPSGTPNRCVLPTTISAPNSAGDCKQVNAIKSVANTAHCTRFFCRCHQFSVGMDTAIGGGILELNTPKTSKSALFPSNIHCNTQCRCTDLNH